MVAAELAGSPAQGLTAGCWVEEVRDWKMSEQRVSSDGGMQTSYGFRTVSDGEKQDLVNDVFHKVARRYDIMNDVMSGGLHRVWKDAMVASLNPPRRPGFRFLDVAGGTGDIAFRIVAASDGQAQGTVLDINGSMLGVGAERAAKKGYADNLDFVEANAEELPFEDASSTPTPSPSASATCPTSTRRCAKPTACFAAAAAFSASNSPRSRCRCSTRSMMPGRSTAFRRWERRSPARPSPTSIWSNRSASSRARPISPRMIERAGFSRVGYTNYTGGIAALHSAWKI
jgi:demethylmenaquinone methyltransferase/2-methoxy-6-polyprenyl-1,4-benzoquinol methylase